MEIELFPHCTISHEKLKFVSNILSGIEYSKGHPKPLRNEAVIDMQVQHHYRWRYQGRTVIKNNFCNDVVHLYSWYVFHYFSYLLQK